MTPNRLDYLKVIFNNNEKNLLLTNKIIAETLGLSAASVSEMLQKLVNKDLIYKDKKLGYAVSEKGLIEVKNILNKHRLWEVFLINHLNYKWDEVHHDADLFEHVTSDEMMYKLNDFLGKPHFCPHGGEIYLNTDNFQRNIVPLSFLKVKDSGIIFRFSDEVGMLNYIEKSNLMIGGKVTIKDKDDFDGMMTVLFNDRELYISEKASREIFVEIENHV